MREPLVSMSANENSRSSSAFNNSGLHRLDVVWRFFRSAKLRQRDLLRTQNLARKYARRLAHLRLCVDVFNAARGVSGGEVFY